MRRRDFLNTRWTLGSVVLLVATVLTLSPQTTHGQQSQGRRVDDSALRNAGTSGEEWLTYGLDLGEKRYSPLTQIDATNVTRLGPAWSFNIPGSYGPAAGCRDSSRSGCAASGHPHDHHCAE